MPACTPASPRISSLRLGGGVGVPEVGGRGREGGGGGGVSFFFLLLLLFLGPGKDGGSVGFSLVAHFW